MISTRNFMSIAIVCVPLCAIGISEDTDLPTAAVVSGFRDDFENRYDTTWSIHNENSDNVSLTRRSGMLTITTETGGIWKSRDTAKNIFLVDKPDDIGDFVMSTRIVGFDPHTRYQQAGLICFDDTDNYVKFVLEFDQGNGGRALAVVPELEGVAGENRVLRVNNLPVKDLWLRVVRYGDSLVFSASRNGERYRKVAVLEWEAERPAQVGLIAKNGPRESTPGIDASFDFFEVVSLSSRPELKKPTARAIERGVGF